MISIHIGKFVVLIITASFHKQSEGELLTVFFKRKNFDYLKNIRLLFLLIH